MNIVRGFARFPSSLWLVAVVAAGAAAMWAVEDPSALTFPSPSGAIRAVALPPDGAVDVNGGVRLSIPVFRHERDRRGSPLFGIAVAFAARARQIAAGPVWPARIARLDPSIPGSGFGRAPPLA